MRASADLSVPEHFLSPPKLAKLLGVGESKVLHWIKSGVLPAFNLATGQLGRPRYRVAPDALQSFLESRKASPPLPAPATKRAKRSSARRAGSSGTRRGGRATTASFGRALTARLLEQPLPHVVRHRLQPLIADLLPVDAGHVRAFVAHDVVDGRLVLRLVGHGAEDVAQRVEAQPFATVDVELRSSLAISLVTGLSRGRPSHQLPPYLVTKTSSASAPAPSASAAWPGPRVSAFDRFRPQRTAAVDAGLRPRVVHPAAVQVQGGQWAACRSPQLPKPQLMPSRSMAFSGMPAASISRRTSSAVNSFGPCFLLAPGGSSSSTAA